MSTDATVVIKGRNDLGYAVKQAESQLKGLLKTGELVGKFFRGGAILGAAYAFERLAENAEKASLAIGDKGTADSLRKLNREIDNLKNKGTNLLGKVLGNAYGAFSSDRLLQLREQVDFLRRMQGRSFVAAGYDDIGTGFFTAAEGAAKLLELEKQLAIYEGSRAFGSRSRAPGGQGGRGRSVFVPDAPDGKPAKDVGYVPTAESNAYVAMLERMGEANRHFEGTLGDADEMIRDQFAESLEAGEKQLESITQTTKIATSEMTIFAEEAGRNMQSAFADFLFDPFSEGLDGMLAGFIKVVQRMVAEALSAQILAGFFGAFSGIGGGGAGSIGAFFGSMSKGIGGRAGGGFLSAGQPSWVGERGKEMFIPSTSGTVVPNHALGGGVTINYNMDNRGASMEFQKALPGILQASEQRTISKVRELVGRGRLV
jgi:hypothetical protein